MDGPFKSYIINPFYNKMFSVVAYLESEFFDV